MPVEWGPGPQLLQIPDCIEGKKAPVVYSHPTCLDPGPPSLSGFREFLEFSCSRPGRGGSCPVEGSPSTGRGSALVWPGRGPAQPARLTAPRGPADAVAGGSVPRSESSPRPRGNGFHCLVGPRGRRSHYAAPGPRGSAPAPTLREWRPRRDRWPLIWRCPRTHRRGQPWRTGFRPAAHSTSATAETRTGALRVRASLFMRDQSLNHPSPRPPANVRTGSPPRRDSETRGTASFPCVTWGNLVSSREQLKGGGELERARARGTFLTKGIRKE